MPSHTPVLFRECLDELNIQPSGIYVDATLGLGGHAQGICERLDEHGMFIGLDQDSDALEIAAEALKGFSCDVKCVRANYRELPSMLKDMDVPSVDGILLDLGVSSLQFDSGERGFSFRSAAPLDMRMDQRSPLSAEILVNEWPEQEIADVIWRYGEERYSRKIARRIVQWREQQRITTTEQLGRLVAGCYGHLKKKPKTHPATKTFQALRIAVNDELNVLSEFLEPGASLLKPGGRMCVISYHSLEDRIVKRGFKRLANEDVVKLIHKKPIVPSGKEIQRNRRARSAKLRVCEKDVGALCTDSIY